jgi:hypothetical protein
MAILRVANIHFNTAGTSNLAFFNDNVVRVRANAMMVPVGSTTNRPTGEPGMIRYNTTTGSYEGYLSATWGALGGGGYFSGNNGDVGTAAGLGDIYRVHTNIQTGNVTIYSGNNAMACGPITIDTNRSLVIQTNARVSIV